MKRSLIFGLAVLAAGCGAGGPLAARTYDFKLNVKPNDVFKYQMLATQVGQKEGGMKLEMTMQTKVLEVKDDKITTESQFLDMKLNGQSMPQPTGATMKQVMDRHGNPISSSASGSGGDMSPSTPLPTKPVKVGETWQVDMGEGKEKQKVSFTFKEVRNEGSREVAVFEATGASAKGMKIEGPAVMWVDTKTGMPVKMSMVAEMEGGLGKMSVELKQV